MTSDSPRAELPPAAQRTDKQVIDAFVPFNANEIDTFRIEGKNALWLTPKETADGQPPNPTTVNLKRIE